MEMNGRIDMKAQLGAVLIHADGTRQELGTLSVRHWYERAWHWLIRRVNERGIVTTAGVNYMATDFASGGVTPTISGFKFHDCGTGSTAAAVTDTALGSAAGTSRVSGTASNPSANVYKTIATISFTTSLAITEWGLFSASTSGTLWDRRVFSAINVVNGDSIQFTYQLTCNNGGS